MIDRRAVLGVLLSGVLVGCAAGAADSPPRVSPWTEAPIVAVGPASAGPSATVELPTQAPSPTVAPSSIAASEPTATATPEPTTADLPPTPTGVAFHIDASEDDTGQYAQITEEVTWRAPRTPGLEMRVYGVTKCLAEPAVLPTIVSSGPCLVEHAALPAAVRTLLGTAPAESGVIRWHWTEESGCSVGLEYDPNGPAYVAIVIAAYNGSAHSIFAIAEPGLWVVDDPNDVIC